MFLKQKELFKDLYNRGFDRINELGSGIDSNDLDYVCKATIHTIKLDNVIRPTDFYDQINNSKITFKYENNSQKNI